MTEVHPGGDGVFAFNDSYGLSSLDLSGCFLKPHTVLAFATPLAHFIES